MANAHVGRAISKAYAKFRPTPPKKYEEAILNYVREKIPGPLKTAVDVGCGTGQSTILWSPHFQKVLGFDISDTQIAEARKSAGGFSNTEFRLSKAESLPVESGTVQLLTAATCIHWFDIEKFFCEAKRVLTPDGAIVVSTMWPPVLKSGDPAKSPLVDRALTEQLAQFVHNIGKDYHEPLYSMVSDRYKSLHLPFNDTRRIEDIWSIYKGNVELLKGLCRSWNLYNKLVKEKGKEVGEKAISQFTERIMEILQSDSEKDTVIEYHYEYMVLLGRKKGVC